MKGEAGLPGAVSTRKRVALAMIEAAEVSGELSPGRTIDGPTSGNTGVGLVIRGLIAGL